MSDKSKPTKDKIREILKLNNGRSEDTISHLRDEGFRFADRNIRKQIKEIKQSSPVFIPKQEVATLTFADTENSPLLAYSFNTFKAFISPEMVVAGKEPLSLQYEVFGTDEVVNVNLRDHSRKELIHAMWHMLDKSDIVVAHNAIKFDIKMINRFFIEERLPPPSPYKVIDTLQVAKQVSAYDHKSLKGLSLHLNFDDMKLDTDGIALWFKCMSGTVHQGNPILSSVGITDKVNHEAWDKMVEYGNGDIKALKELYFTLRPYMKGHPNVNLYKTDPTKMACTTCGSPHVELENDLHHTSVNSYSVYRCMSCGSLSRARTGELNKEKRTPLTGSGV